MARCSNQTRPSRHARASGADRGPRCRHRGAMAATGRSIMDVAHLLPGVLRDLAVCSNGAVVYSARLDRVLLCPIEPVVIEAFVETLQALAPQISFATLVNNGYDMLPGPGYPRPDGGRQPRPLEADHDRGGPGRVGQPTRSEAGRPQFRAQVGRSVRPASRQPTSACSPPCRGVPFVEISAAAVSKATTPICWRLTAASAGTRSWRAR